MDVIIRIPKDVADTKLGKTKLLTILKQMGAEVVAEEKPQVCDVHAADDVMDVFSYHQEKLGDQFPRGLKLTSERRSIIRARLRRFSVDELKQCVDYVSQSAFHLGKNDANKKYLDFDHIMSNDIKVERKLDGMVGANEKSGRADEVRLTLRRIGAKIRSGSATYTDKEQLSRLVSELREMTGEVYRWKSDEFTRGE